MRARLILEIIDDNGELIATNEVADLDKKSRGAEDLGLSLLEGKALLAKLQQHMVETQVDLWLRDKGMLDGCRLRRKGSYPITFHTLFGDVRLKSPGFYLPVTRDTSVPAIALLRSVSFLKRGGPHSCHTLLRRISWQMCFPSAAVTAP